MKAIRAAGFTILVATIGAAVWCCGPKLPAPEAVPTCPNGAFEVCEPGDGKAIGPHNCFCPE